MNQIIITSLATDTFFNFVRLGITVKDEVCSEDFVYFKKFDPATRNITPEQMEEWVTDCKKESMYHMSVTRECGDCCEDCTPPAQPTAAPVTAPAVEAAPVVQAPKPEPKKRAPKAAPAPVVEAPVAPVVEAPVVVAPAAPAVEFPKSTVAYDKLNKDHARWLQAKLDALDAGWKADAKKVDFARNKLVPSMHCNQIIFVNDVECAETVAALGQVFLQQDVSLWPTT